MLISEIRLAIPSTSLFNRVVLSDGERLYKNFTVSVVRDYVPQKLPTSILSNPYGTTRFEQLMLITTVDIESPLLMSDILAINTQPLTDLEVTFKIGEGAHFTPIMVSFIDDKAIAKFQT